MYRHPTIKPPAKRQKRNITPSRTSSRPAIHRKSLSLYQRVDGRPRRQPLLDHAGDEDFVAAYLGYENVEDLAKLRFTGFILSLNDRLEDEYMRYSTYDKLLAMAVLLQFLNCACFPATIEAFRRMLQDDPLAVGNAGASEILECWLVFAESSTRPELRFMICRSPNTTSIAVSRILYLRGLRSSPGPEDVCRLPYDQVVVRMPTMSEHEEDLEGVVRIIALTESLKYVSKASVWRNRVPRTLDSPGSEEVDIVYHL